MLSNTLNTLFIILQFMLPKHLLSRLIARAADNELTWVKNTLIKLAIKVFKINMSEAISEDLNTYKNFNDFFTRPLKAGLRPHDKDKNIICSPCDGLISQFGTIHHGQLIQAKGHLYPLLDLLAGKEALANQFKNGTFACIYLAPKDYHRVHMPYDGDLVNSIYVPGELFSVNQVTAQNIKHLFTRNERLINIFQTDKGPIAVILVGAMLVAGIETVWSGQVAPPKGPINIFEKTNSEVVKLNKAQEMGRFKFGSTVILLFPEGMTEWDQKLSSQQVIKMGETIARLK